MFPVASSWSLIPLMSSMYPCCSEINQINQLKRSCSSPYSTQTHDFSESRVSVPESFKTLSGTRYNPTRHFLNSIKMDWMIHDLLTWMIMSPVALNRQDANAPGGSLWLKSNFFFLLRKHKKWITLLWIQSTGWPAACPMTDTAHVGNRRYRGPLVD